MARAGARNKALKGKRLVNEENLGPLIAAGLTQGVPKEEAVKLHPSRTTGGAAEQIRHMHDADKRLESGVRYAPFVAESNTNAVWTDGVTDRPQMDYTKTYTEAGLRLLREGRQCLRCDEPLEIPFPIACPLCGYSVKERQIMDIAMEFEGTKHLGPRAPISEYLEELEARTEKRKFIDKVIEGGQGKIPKSWIRDAHLFPDGPDPRVV